jgi:mRNA interferase MazF
MRRGDLYLVRKPKSDAKESRAFVVVSREALLRTTFSTVICAPVYSRGEDLTTQVAVGPDQGLKHQSWIMCDNLSVAVVNVPLLADENVPLGGSLGNRARARRGVR